MSLFDMRILTFEYVVILIELIILYIRKPIFTTITELMISAKECMC